MEYWVEANKGKSWDDFLLAVKHRFDHEFYKPYAATVSFGLFRRTGGTSRDQRQPIRTSAKPIANQEPDRQLPQRNREITQVSDVIQIGAQPFNVVSSKNCAKGSGPKPFVCDGSMNIESINVVDNEMMSEENTISHNENIPVSVGIAAAGAPERIVSMLELADDIVPSNTGVSNHGVILSIKSAQPIKDPRYRERPTLSFTDAMKSLPQQFLFGFGDRHLFRLEQEFIYDARLIPPRDDATLLGRNLIIDCKAPPSRIANSASFFKMLRNCMADPDDN